MADYQVTIAVNPNTLTNLVNGNYSLYGFKAVQTTQSGGLPLVWLRMDEYLENNVIEWDRQYQAYTSNSEIIANGRVVVGFYADISLGQMLNVAADGPGAVVGGGPSTAISIANSTAAVFTCGLSEMAGMTTNPISTFPLDGNKMDDFTPLEKVLLIFSTNQMKTGTAIDYLYGANSLASDNPAGVFIDLTSTRQCAVSFDIDNGWDWGGYAWATQIPSNSSLVPLLIEDGNS